MNYPYNFNEYKAPVLPVPASNQYKNYVKIYLVRHGESEENSTLRFHNPNFYNLNSRSTHSSIHSSTKVVDSPLSLLGQRQAELTASHLASELNTYTTGLFLCSPYLRARQTMLPLQRILNLNDSQVYILDSIREYTKFIDQPLEFRDLKSDDQWSDFQKRILDFVADLKIMIQNFSPVENTVIIYGHSLFFSSLLSYLGTQESILPTFDSLSFQLPNCSISTIGFDPSYQKWKILAIGSIKHLGKEVTGNQLPMIRPFTN